MSETAIVGIGNLWRGDDGFGLVALQHLRDRLKGRVDFVESHGDMTELLDCFRSHRCVYILDALKSDGGALADHKARLHVLDAHAGQFKAVEFRGSSHVLGLAQAIEMARALGALPQTLKIVGVEGEDFTLRMGLSERVESALGDVIDLVAQWVEGEEHA